MVVREKGPLHFQPQLGGCLTFDEKNWCRFIAMLILHKRSGIPIHTTTVQILSHANMTVCTIILENFEII